MTIYERAVVEANLGTTRPECDQAESPDDSVEVRIGRGLKYPKDKGYAKFLATLGYDRNWAGMQAAYIVEQGRIRVATSRKRTAFAKALRQLAKPRLATKAFLDNARVALEAMDGTMLADELFLGPPPFEGLVFIPALQLCLAGDLSARSEVARLAEAAWRRVPVVRGPKLTLASAAHEYFLESLRAFLRAGFTWSPYGEDFTDRLTIATREEFEDSDFSPVSARRRLRAEQR
jgi:hypothetical protein